MVTPSQGHQTSLSGLSLSLCSGIRSDVLVAVQNENYLTAWDACDCHTVQLKEFVGLSDSMEYVEGGSHTRSFLELSCSVIQSVVPQITILGMLIIVSGMLICGHLGVSIDFSGRVIQYPTWSIGLVKVRSVNDWADAANILTEMVSSCREKLKITSCTKLLEACSRLTTHNIASIMVAGLLSCPSFPMAQNLLWQCRTVNWRQIFASRACPVAMQICF